MVTASPATGEAICRVQAAGPADVERAVEAARQGFAVWSKMTGAERGRVLARAAALLSTHALTLPDWEHPSARDYDQAAILIFAAIVVAAAYGTRLPRFATRWRIERAHGRTSS